MIPKYLKRSFWFVCIFALVACGSNNQADEGVDADGELLSLDVEFELPEQEEVGETVELKATVTYGGEMVTDADEVVFEHWLAGNEDDSTMVESTNHEDGTYTAKVTFEEDGVYEIYAHTTARDLHTMPKKSITIGDGHAESNDASNHDHGHHDTEGFVIHLMDINEVKVAEEADFVVHLQLDEEPFENANVRYEIWNTENENEREWIDATESKAGEYLGTHTFDEAGTYTINVHVEDDEDLHEHSDYNFEVVE
ncbi:FixH family protein [Oceanobacillus polygoni]|uniref:Plastocyanin n=1 Tax=Oceanobacillus polygoni TaxID=1235259 RepID=A0A9X0YPA7_9BACI|nr:FixH family protein [Oceanobacillus polygoni]MBP2076234.1 plastocyanin [Oceanobacillus polygoni]